MRLAILLGVATALTLAGAAEARARHPGHRPHAHHVSFNPGKTARGFPMPRPRHPRL